MTSTAATQAQFSLPAFNINGTNPRSIENEYHQALQALRIAEQMLVNCTCHGRDFQKQLRAAFLKAREEREQMLAHCQAIHDYLETWYWYSVDNN